MFTIFLIFYKFSRLPQLSERVNGGHTIVMDSLKPIYIIFKLACPWTKPVSPACKMYEMEMTSPLSQPVIVKASYVKTANGIEA